MRVKEFLEKLNFPTQCKKYGVPLWQCPSFLFLIMGLIIIFLILISYALSLRYIEDPRIASLIILFVATILLIIAFVINNSFERLFEANKMKTEFVEIVCHQLRAPISNLKWAIEFLLSGRLGKIESNQMEYLKILEENSKRMGELIKDLLIVSQIESQKLPQKKEKFSLEDLTIETINEFSSLAQKNGIKINYSFGEKIPLVFANKHQIKQVIENLLDNAIRYSKENGFIEIKIERKDKKVYFEVKDNGVGIPKEEQKYIFQKFFRAKNIKRYQTLGTGLGLYISKALVERSGGKIGFFSQEDKGSTFWFKLPIK
jgi:signal transduction histidine kinase